MTKKTIKFVDSDRKLLTKEIVWFRVELKIGKVSAETVRRIASHKWWKCVYGCEKIIVLNICMGSLTVFLNNKHKLVKTQKGGFQFYCALTENGLYLEEMPERRFLS